MLQSSLLASFAIFSSFFLLPVYVFFSASALIAFPSLIVFLRLVPILLKEKSSKNPSYVTMDALKLSFVLKVDYCRFRSSGTLDFVDYL